MRRGAKILVVVLVALALLLVLNAVVLDRQTRPAEQTLPAAEIMKLPGGDLQVLDSGPRSAPPIVLVHCFACSINWWERITPLLSRGNRVIAVDLVGHGGSEKPGSGYSMPDQAELVARALARLEVRDATVVGHSLGGSVAVALAEESSQLVGGLVIVDTEPDTSYGSLGLLARAVRAPVVGEALWRVKLDWNVRKGLEEAFAPGYDIPDQFVDDVGEMTYTAYDDSASAFDSYVGDSSLDDRIQALEVPLLVVFGAEEQIVDDPREALSAYADVPDAQTALLQGAGHSPNVEKPGQTAALILRFARETRVAPDRTGADSPSPSGRPPSPNRPCARPSRNGRSPGARRGDGRAAAQRRQARCRKARRSRDARPADPAR